MKDREMTITQDKDGTIRLRVGDGETIHAADLNEVRAAVTHLFYGHTRYFEDCPLCERVFQRELQLGSDRVTTHG